MTKHKVYFVFGIWYYALQIKCIILIVKYNLRMYSIHKWPFPILLLCAFIFRNGSNIASLCRIMASFNRRENGRKANGGKTQFWKINIRVLMNVDKSIYTVQTFFASLPEILTHSKPKQESKHDIRNFLSSAHFSVLWPAALGDWCRELHVIQTSLRLDYRGVFPVQAWSPSGSRNERGVG